MYARILGMTAEKNVLRSFGLLTMYFNYDAAEKRLLSQARGVVFPFQGKKRAQKIPFRDVPDGRVFQQVLMTVSDSQR